MALTLLRMRLWQPRTNLSSYSHAVLNMLELPGSHGVVCSYGEHILVCYGHRETKSFDALDISADIFWFKAISEEQFVERLSRWFDSRIASDRPSTHMLPTMYMVSVCDKIKMSDDELLDATADMRRLREAEMAASIKDRRKHVQSLESKIRELDDK